MKTKGVKKGLKKRKITRGEINLKILFFKK
jgi:hypothetical protein